jgi:hypothetical protein
MFCTHVGFVYYYLRHNSHQNVLCALYIQAIVISQSAWILEKVAACSENFKTVVVDD